MELRKGLVEKYYKKIGIDITVDELIVTVAGSESVNLALEITCNPGDEVIVLEPFYTNYNTFAFMLIARDYSRKSAAKVRQFFELSK